jgi:hypothetical protein
VTGIAAYEPGLRRTNSTVKNASQAKSAPAAGLSLFSVRATGHRQAAQAKQKTTTKSPGHQGATKNINLIVSWWWFLAILPKRKMGLG